MGLCSFVGSLLCLKSKMASLKAVALAAENFVLGMAVEVANSAVAVRAKVYATSELLSLLLMELFNTSGLQVAQLTITSKLEMGIFLLSQHAVWGS